MATYRIDNKGMGGFLCPPRHPAHVYSVAYYDCGHGSMSIEAALEDNYVPENIKTDIRHLLNVWMNTRPSLHDDSVRDWIYQVLGYFRNCWKNEKIEKDQWDASNLIIENRALTTENAHLHAGVNLIRKYYPSYTPSPEDVQWAYWGKKPSKEVA